MILRILALTGLLALSAFSYSQSFGVRLQGCLGSIGGTFTGPICGVNGFVEYPPVGVFAQVDGDGWFIYPYSPRNVINIGIFTITAWPGVMIGHLDGEMIYGIRSDIIVTGTLAVE